MKPSIRPLAALCAACALAGGLVLSLAGCTPSPAAHSEKGAASSPKTASGSSAPQASAEKPKPQGASKIDYQQALDLLMTDSATELIDVRTPQEFAEKRIPGARNIPLDKLPQVASRELAQKDAPIIVYCRSGNRSGKAAQELVKQGYTHVYDLGALTNWKDEFDSGE